MPAWNIFNALLYFISTISLSSQSLLGFFGYPFSATITVKALSDASLIDNLDKYKIAKKIIDLYEKDK